MEHTTFESSEAAPRASSLARIVAIHLFRSCLAGLASCIALGFLACAGTGPVIPPPPAPPSTSLVYVSGGGTISTFRLDAQAATLSPVEVREAGRRVSFLAWNPGGTSFYVADQDEAGLVLAFSRDAATGALTSLGRASSGGSGPVHVSVDATGRWVLVANYASKTVGTVGVLPVQPDGGVGEPVDIEALGADAMPHLIIPDPGNRFVFVPCKGLAKVMQFRFDAASGQLTPNEPDHIATAPGAGPRHLAFHPDGRLAYLINEQDSTLSALRFDQATGLLQEIETQTTLPPGFSGQNTTADVRVHPNGRFVYGSNRGHDSIVIFALDPDSGRMTLVGHETRTIGVPRNFHIAPGGRLMLVANQSKNTVSVFRIDEARGTLALAGDPTPVSRSPQFVGVLR